MVCLGIGGGALPALFAARLPNVTMDAVDIDPVVVVAAAQLLSMASLVRTCSYWLVIHC